MRKTIVSPVMLSLFFSLECLFLSACATRINQPPAPLEHQSTVEQFQLDENVSRVHIFNLYGSAIELYINNEKIGLLGNVKEYMAIDLYPGVYDLKWISKSPGDGGILKPMPLQLSIARNELTFIKAKFAGISSPIAEKFGGAIAAAAGSKFIAYFEQDANMKSHLHEYKLILLNKDMKKSQSK